MARLDPHSYFDADQPRTRRLQIALDVDFARQVLTGRVVLDLGGPVQGVLDLDTKGLTLRSVRTGDGRAVAKLPIGKGTDAVVFDSDANLVFSSNGDGTLTVIHGDSPDAFRVVQNLATKEGARTMALDPKTHAIFLPTARFEPPPPATPENPRPRRQIVEADRIRCPDRLLEKPDVHAVMDRVD